MAKLTIIRGLPGSGKSTLARSLGVLHYEADMYHMQHGVYVYDAGKARAAHAWCLAQVASALQLGLDVVVSNTFTTMAELQPYLMLSDDLVVLECHADYGNVHGVPAEVLERMRRRWESLPV